MKPRWLLLAVGVVCLLVLAPAAALSQGGTEIACGSAVIDGTVGAAEWEGATKLPMRGYYEGDGAAGIPSGHGAGLTGQLHPAANGRQTDGWLYLKNDARYLYVGATMDIGDENPDWWQTELEVAFTDEPCAEPDAWLDDTWWADTCEDDPGEGWFWAEEGEYDGHWTSGPYFEPDSEEGGYCEDDDEPAQGVIAKAGRHTAHYEMRIDLTSSELNCAGPGDCFRFYAYQEELFCPTYGPECFETDWTAGWVAWPAFDNGEWEAPDAFGTICLNPCEVEFVPEPATMLLLGSGLASLAGYAGLRRRARS